MSTVFKVGMFVKYIDSYTNKPTIGRITSLDYRKSGYHRIAGSHESKCECGIKASLLTPWEPQFLEWCWFYNSHKKTPKLAKFRDYDSTLRILYRTTKGKWYKYCEPFIGELPTNLKED